MTNIVIFGGNGFAGSAIAEEAQKRGHSVTTVSRSAAGNNEVAGSITDQATLEKVLPGADVVVVSTPAAPALESVEAITKLAAANNVRLSYVGGAGSLLVAEGGPKLIDTPDFQDEWKEEASTHSQVLDFLRSAPEDLNWFYVSPAALFGSWTGFEATGAYQVGGDVLLTDDNGESKISGVDFALGFVDEIELPKHKNERLTLAQR